uniref:Integrase catalytic domain-containing protein n=1 Tax=Denticeps clupeoides TaxID=299321 RepID=A0AAY4CXQ7_9TELE
MRWDVQNIVRSCTVCAVTKVPRVLPAGKLLPLPVLERPWSHITVDFVTDLPESNGYTTILVVVDRFPKGCCFVPFPSLPSALQMAEALMQSVFRVYGIPEDILSDRGPQFVSRVWKAFFQKLGVSVNLTSGYHPESNGQAERLIQELCRFRAYFWAEYGQNSLRHSATGLTPFECVLGRQPPLCPWDRSPSEVSRVDDWFRRTERVWEGAHCNIQRAVLRFTKQADRRRRDAPVLKAGGRVWLSSRDLQLHLPSKKLPSKYVGPFVILKQVNPVSFKLQLPSHMKVSPVFHVSLLKPVTPGPLDEGEATPTLPPGQDKGDLWLSPRASRKFPQPGSRGEAWHFTQGHFSSFILFFEFK